MSVTYKQRSVDHGNGTQYVEIVNGTVTKQWLQGNGPHSYTGNGNPEIVGKPQSKLRGYGFRNVSQSKSNSLLETLD